MNMEYVKLFRGHSDYEDFLSGDTVSAPNVSHCIQENEIHYGQPSDPRLIVKYYVTDASEPTLLYAYYAEEGHDAYWTKGVDKFKSIEIDGTEVSIQDIDAAEGHYQLPVGEHTVKYLLKDSGIWRSLFQSCNKITSVAMPDGITSIGAFAFQFCTGLSNITISNGVTSIGEYAFSFCSSLTNIVVPDSVTNIGDYAFLQTHKLSSVTLGSGVTTIGENAFTFCNGLTTIISLAMTAPETKLSTFQNIKSGGTLYVPGGSTGYDAWMQNGAFCLNNYNWVKVEQ